MNLQDCQHLLAESLSRARSVSPFLTPLGQTGESVIRMVSSYECDGRVFFSQGDPVNALVAFWYGFGWLHGGIAIGLLVTGTRGPGCPFTSAIEPLLSDHRVKLDEKTLRYHHLLDTAIRSVSPAPDPSIPMHRFALQVFCTAGAYRERGQQRMRDGYREDALACFSYGHGWLDAGVEAGLFTVLANREIFTV